MVWMWTAVVLLLNTVELTSRDNMPAEPKMYKIQEGDTLSDLFGQNWQEVAAFNGIEDPTKLQIGQEINVNLYEPPVKQTPAPQEMNTSASGEQGFLKGAADWATGYFEDFTVGAEAFGDDVYSTFVNSPMPQTLEELGSPEELAAMEDIGAPVEAPVEAPATNTFEALIKEKENAARKGFDTESGTWTPHESAEGGTDTVAWGHKLTDPEQAGGYVVIGGEQVPFNELTEEKSNLLFKQDWANKTGDAAKFINEEGDWESLSESQKLITTELFYNMGNKAKQYKNFRTKVLAQDEDFINEIGRTYTNEDGEVRPLLERTDDIKDWYKTSTK